TFLLRHGVLTLALFAAVVVAGGGLFTRVPGALVPNEDQGTAIVITKLPDSSSLAHTARVADQILDFELNHPLAEHAVSLVGLDFLSLSLKPNSMSQFVSMKDWNERKGKDQSIDAFTGQLMEIGR